MQASESAPHATLTSPRNFAVPWWTPWHHRRLPVLDRLVFEPRTGNGRESKIGKRPAGWWHARVPIFLGPSVHWTPHAPSGQPRPVSSIRRWEIAGRTSRTRCRRRRRWRCASCWRRLLGGRTLMARKRSNRKSLASGPCETRW